MKNKEDEPVISFREQLTVPAVEKCSSGSGGYSKAFHGRSRRQTLHQLF